MLSHSYLGTELALFADCHNWKSYFASCVREYVSGHILEVGAGVGSNTPFLWTANVSSWVCMEPDTQLARQLNDLLVRQQPNPRPNIVVGTIASLVPAPRFNTILYIDVLEHIEHDDQELLSAERLLLAGGYLVVLAPAHQRLFSPFDRAIGHYRRYDSQMLRRAYLPTSTLARLCYLDSVGLIASAANRLALRAAMPTPGQLQLWDRLFVPASRIVDPLTGHRFGKSILAVWQKQSNPVRL